MISPAILLTLPAIAEDLPEAPTVVVTATRFDQPDFDLPISVNSVGRRRLSEAQWQENLSESLGPVPGIVARNRQNYAQDLQISSRGFGARASFGVRGIRLYADGIPATLADGQGQLSHFDLGSAARVEVMRGPFSALYGNSSGGVIAVFTENGEPGAFVEPQVTIGSDGAHRFATKWLGDNGKLNYVVNAASFSTDGYRAHSAARRDTANAKFGWKMEDGTQISLVANGIDMPESQDPIGLTRAQYQGNARASSPAAEIFNTRKSVEQQQLGINVTRDLTDVDKLQLQLYGGQRTISQFLSVPVAAQSAPTSAGGVIDLDRGYHGMDLRWVHVVEVARLPIKASIGISYDELNEKRRGYENFVGSMVGVRGALRRDEDNDVTAFDQYMQIQAEPGERWLLFAGMRNSGIRVASRDHYQAPGNGDDSGDTHFSAATGSAGVTYRAGEGFKIYAACGTGFETPTLNEIAYRPGGASGLNYDLAPMRNSSLEIGVKFLSEGGMRANLAIFDVNTRDEIVVATNAGGRASYRNAGNTSRRGTELTFGTSSAAEWSLLSAVSWIDPRFRTTDAAAGVFAGKVLPGLPRTQIYLEGVWRDSRAGLSAGIEIRRASQTWVDDRNSDVTAGYTLVDLRATFERRYVGLVFKGFFKVANALDKKYAGSVIVNEANGRYFEPGSGRSFLSGVSVRYEL